MLSCIISVPRRTSYPTLPILMTHKEPNNLRANPSLDPCYRNSFPHIEWRVAACTRQTQPKTQRPCSSAAALAGLAPSTHGASGDGGGAAQPPPPQLCRSCTRGYKNAAAFKDKCHLSVSSGQQRQTSYRKPAYQKGITI